MVINMELVDEIKKGIWQCEGRHKCRLEQEKKTPIERYSDVYKFSFLLSSSLKGIRYDLFLFIPTTKNKPCYITEEGGKNLNLKEIYDPETYNIVRENLIEFSKYYDELTDEGKDYFTIFEYNSYKIDRDKATEIIWRILNNTISARVQRVNMIIIKLFLPTHLKAISFKLEEIPEGYLFIFLPEKNVNRNTLEDIGRTIKDVYINFIKENEEIDVPIREIERSVIEKRKRSFGEIPGDLGNRVFIGGNYDNMAILNYLKDIVYKSDFHPILAFDYNVPKDDIHDFDLRLVPNCKYTIFEVTTPQGELMEILRSVDYRNRILLLYQVREPDDMEMPQQITTMLSTLKYDSLEKQGYNHINELNGIVETWLKGLKRK